MQCRSQDAAQLSKTRATQHVLTWHYRHWETPWDLQHWLSLSLLLFQQTNRPGNAHASDYFNRSLNRDQRSQILSMNVGSQCTQAQEHQQPELSLPSWRLLALLSMTWAQDVARSSQDRACPAICYASASWALFWPKARLWTPTLSPSQKAIRDPAKLLITFWKKSVVKN